MNKYFKHINYTAEDIAAEKYEAWDLIRPMWLVYDIYKDRARYEETAAQFTFAQRRAHAWVYYNNEVINGGHQQFLINSTVADQILEMLTQYMRLHSYRFSQNRSNQVWSKCESKMRRISL